MAGGALAEQVACLVCLLDDGVLTRATRTYEGVEDDQYRCELGHGFGVDYSHGPATERGWPPTEELEAIARQVRGD